MELKIAIIQSSLYGESKKNRGKIFQVNWIQFSCVDLICSRKCVARTLHVLLKKYSQGGREKDRLNGCTGSREKNVGLSRSVVFFAMGIII